MGFNGQTGETGREDEKVEVEWMVKPRTILTMALTVLILVGSLGQASAINCDLVADAADKTYRQYANGETLQSVKTSDTNNASNDSQTTVAELNAILLSMIPCTSWLMKGNPISKFAHTFTINVFRRSKHPR